MECTPELIEKLSKVEIFSDFDTTNEIHRKILEKVCVLLEPETFPKGAFIIKEGDLGNSLFILYEGTVQVKRNTPSNEQFAVVNLAAEQNVFFGEVALVDKDTRSASVLALTECRTLRLDGTTFKTLCDEEPILGYRVMYQISRRLAGSLRRSNRDMMTLYAALLDEVEGGSGIQ
ncbi:MAG: cyclic nucleotide-binding domain-containing protein [Treponemataceae bacterium]|nr:cyclic nucleotide-binding domain-containing protein [Treponemataceae bacterium]